jgi:hypothetical protein
MRRNFDCKLPGENMNDKRPPEAPFHAGEPVFLALGTYQGTPGVFLRFREDRSWADVEELGGAVRCHPVAWLGHSPAIAPAVHGTV